MKYPSAITEVKVIYDDRDPMTAGWFARAYNDTYPPITEWCDKHPNSPYFVPGGAKCDVCKKILTAAERWRNIVENEEQDGNAVLCQEHQED